jgi:hypothetical protein
MMSVSAKCSDLCSVTLDGSEHSGYVPNNINIGGGDYVDFDVCANCGQMIGTWPLPHNDDDDDTFLGNIAQFAKLGKNTLAPFPISPTTTFGIAMHLPKPATPTITKPLIPTATAMHLSKPATPTITKPLTPPATIVPIIPAPRQVVIPQIPTQPGIIQRQMATIPKIPALAGIGQSTQGLIRTPIPQADPTVPKITRPVITPLVTPPVPNPRVEALTSPVTNIQLPRMTLVPAPITTPPRIPTIPGLKNEAVPTPTIAAITPTIATITPTIAAIPRLQNPTMPIIPTIPRITK